jgi:signal transduction histidine kinase/DNA-binding NarL/FixJ family response regulator
MHTIIQWLEVFFKNVPFQLMEVWGRFAYMLGFGLMIAAYGGFTFRPAGRWGVGRESQAWDSKAFLAIGLTAVLIPISGYIGSSISLVPGAQTFESLKDLTVLLCVVLFGYPALLAVPPAYMLADLVEGTPPGFILDWLFGYWINPACYWVAYQLIGRHPDFRQLRTWAWYALFALLFLSIEPQLWGYICSGKFTPEFSYQAITPALFFTTSITLLIAPFAMLAALPLARRYGMFWAEIPGHMKERLLGMRGFIWQSGPHPSPSRVDQSTQRWPLRVFIAGPFIALVLLMVTLVAFITLRSGEDAANALAERLHREISLTVDMSVDDYLDPALNPQGLANPHYIGAILQKLSISNDGRAFIVDRTGRVIASSSALSNPQTSLPGGLALGNPDPIVHLASRHFEQQAQHVHKLDNATTFRFDVVTAQPLSRETWLAQATPYRDRARQVDWVIVTATPESNFLGDIRKANSNTAMVVALALFAALMTAVVLAGVVTRAVRRFAHAAQAMATGDLGQRVTDSRLAEMSTLSGAFNHMAEQLQESFVRTRAKEAELRDHRDNLEAQVTARTGELKLALDRADTANRAKSAFLSNMSHELRTPLHAVIGFSRLMAHGDNLTERQRDDVALINRSGNHLLKLINDVLDLSKIEAGQVGLMTTDAYLATVLGEVIGMLRPRAEQAGLFLVLETHGSPVGALHIDSGKLLQVLINLIGNAIKFTKVGGITLDVSVGPTINGMQQIDFTVMDTGIGIAKEDLQAILEPFVQVTTHASAAGTGLGLAVTRQFLALMESELQIESTPGKGSAFSFTLAAPVSTMEPVDATQAAWVTGLPRQERGKRILLVDDTSEARLLLSRLLEPLGFDVKQATDGQHALELAASFAPDLIVMDWHMPGMDGVAATAAIRSKALARQPKIVMLSASAFDDERKQALATGADDFLHKPLEEPVFFAMLERQLGLHFIREAESVIVAPALPTRAELLQLSTASRQLLAIAASELDHIKIDEALALIEGKHPALAASIMAMVDAHQYRSLWDLLQD